MDRKSFPDLPWTASGPSRKTLPHTHTHEGSVSVYVCACLCKMDVPVRDTNLLAGRDILSITHHSLGQSVGRTVKCPFRDEAAGAAETHPMSVCVYVYSGQLVTRTTNELFITCLPCFNDTGIACSEKPIFAPCTTFSYR